MHIKKPVHFTFSYLVILIVINGMMFACGSDPEESRSDELLIEQPSPGETREGHFILQAPKTIQLEETAYVEVDITTDSIRDAHFFEQNMNENDTIISDQIKVGKIMEVNLIEADDGEQGFNIVALSSAQQLTSTEEATHWKWSVRALKEGVHQLIVIAKVKMMTADMQLIGYKDLPVKHQSIQVIVPQEEANEVEEPNNNMLYGGILVAVALLGGFLFWYKSSNKKGVQTIDAQAVKAMKEEVQELIERDKMKQAFNQLEAFLEAHSKGKMAQELTHLQSNYSNNQSMFNKSLIDHEEFNRNRSKLVLELLEMLAKL